jgi:serine/threonine protein kinase/formylglycine-generating enzyme required for sulfatase activity
LLCYRCGSHVPDAAETCEKCGQRLAGGPKGVSLPPRRRPNELEGAPFKVGDKLSGRYRIKTAIGVGPFGVVYRAADEQLDGDVSIKLLQPRLLQAIEERAAFSKVIRLSRKFTHPGLARVLEDGDHDGWPFYTSPFVDGLPLRKVLEPRLTRGHLFQLKEIEPIFTQLASALDAAHAVGAHGDLKPENVLILPDVLKVTDFGLSRALPRPPFVQGLRPSKADRYLAPEIVSGQEFDKAADVYALGVILGEMLTGLLPTGGEAPDLRARVNDLPMQVEAVYRRALNENPQARFGSAGELISELFGKSVQISPPRIPSAQLPTKAENPAMVRQPESAIETRVRPSQELAPPADATMPMSEEEVRIRLGRLPKPPTQPLNEINDLTAAPPPRPLPAGEGPTIAMPSLGGLSAPSAPMSGPAPLFAAARASQPNRGLMLLILLSISGITIGIVGGLWLVSRLKPHPVAVETPVTAPPPVMPRPADEIEPRKPEPRPAPPPLEPAKKIELPVNATHEKESARGETRSASVKTARAEEDLGCPAGMRLISAGAFKQGTARDDPMMGFDEKTLTTVELKAYCVDEFEFPNRRGAMPQVKVSWLEAKKSCESKHKRLCSEPEWEKACKGPENQRYPYGASYDAAACNTEDASGQDRTLGSSGKFTRCRSGYGVMDLSGNVAEWTSSSYGSGSEKALKGGAFNRPDYAARCSARKNASSSARSAEVGFRCCADPLR